MDRSELSSLSPIRGPDGTLRNGFGKRPVKSVVPMQGIQRGRRNAFWTESSFKADSPQDTSPKHREREDSEDDIPLIPDIDDVQEDEYYGDIASAPDLPSTNLSSFIQLNSDLKKYAAFTVFDSINLGLLSKHLFKESDLKENDNKWSWDLLFTEVSSELRSEWESSRGNDSDE